MSAQPAERRDAIGNLSAFAAADMDKDALHALALDCLPLETSSVKRARMIKNVRLESVIELFNDSNTGSGQITVDQLAKMYNWPQGSQHPDEAMLRALANLHSYDVYTLRIQMRKLGIEVENVEALKLSKEKSAELSKYMMSFTRPLIQQIYGDTDSEIQDVQQLIQMFTAPDKGEALKNLRIMAEKLKIGLSDVPRFLEDYGDVFLSLAYYKDCLDDIIPRVMAFEDSMEGLKANYQMKNERRLMKTIAFMSEKLGDITSSITGRFESFDRHSQAMWENITAESFAKVKTLIESHHVTVGGVLCGLSVKMDSWNERFGKGGGLVKMSDFIMSDMMQGMEKMQQIEDSAPKISDL